MKNIFAADSSYKEMTRRYTGMDGWIAVGFYVIFMAVYFLIGVVKAKYTIYLGVPANILLAVLCVFIVFLRKQKLSSVGITAVKIKKSLILGFSAGVLLVLFNNILPGVLSGGCLKSIKSILYSLLYYFVVIAFVEEIVFRGFIQTRLYGLIKNEIAAVVTAGLLFSAMHIPYQMAASGKSFPDFMQANYIWLVLLVLWHVVFNFLYRKYNSIWTGTVFHGLMDWGNSLFL